MVSGALEALAQVDPITSIIAQVLNTRGYKDQTQSTVQGDDIFLAKRWSIALKEMSAYSASYSETGVFFSKPIVFPAGLKSASLKADVLLPEGTTYTFSLSKDGSKWTQIKADGTESFTMDGRETVYVKCELKRTSSYEGLTPTVNWYEIQGIAV
jgi:hypothetical protein